MARHPPVISLSCTQTQFVPQGTVCVTASCRMRYNGEAAAQELGVAMSLFQPPQRVLPLQYLRPPLQRHPESSCKERAYALIFLSVPHAAGTRPGKSPWRFGNRFTALSVSAPLCTRAITQPCFPDPASGMHREAPQIKWIR